MPYTFEQSKDEIARLVKHFTNNRVGYLAPSYKEAHARQEFIDPLFVALNWDVGNSQHAAPDYREVIVEDTLDIEGHAKAPDYAFRVGRERKFFTEAKKPGVDLKNATAPAYQLRRYAWSAKLALSLLTDFEELAVYDCRIRPAPGDKTSVARVNYLRCDEYPDRWQEVWEVFSREAVWGGAFDQFAQASKGKRGASEVDAEFLKEIEGWREVLARNIALRNPQLTIEGLNDAVQRTIDRIIFLRMAEDRGIEEYGRLQRLAQGTNIYTGMLALFRQADARYNSGLFDFSKTGDRVTPELTLDDKTLKPILTDLYYPKSPYEFSVLPVEILGNVYEQFLGKVIRLTAGHQAKVEEKPEVKKAGGVYYTPAYIVNYIVKNTVGKQIDGKSPKQLKGFRVLDMACGSGSFLLGAYQYLLEHYQQWYAEHEPEKHGGAVVQRGEAWRLLTAEKKRILTEHIFGVDIDRQAVEVTKLSLLLKVLEGESDETLGKQLTLWQERALPNLERNIKCGNSLIGPDYFSGQFLPDAEELRRVNPFDWAAEFPEAMQAGGFDCVVGNPPYVRQELLGKSKTYFEQHYAVFHGIADLYSYFIERGVSLLKQGGRFGYIVANKWMRTNYAEPLRRWLKQQHLDEITDFGDLPVFKTATTYPCIVLINKDKPSATFPVTQVKTLNFASLDEYVQTNRYEVNQASLNDSGWSLTDEYTQVLLAKLRRAGISLDEYVKGKVYYGIKTGLNEAFVIDEATRQKLIDQDANSKDLIKPFLIGREVKRYQPSTSDGYVILMPRGWTREASQNSQNPRKWLEKNYPAIAGHLAPFAKEAEQRCDKGEYWWELRACDYYAEFEKPKIIYPNICKQPEFTFDVAKRYTNQKCFIIPLDDKYLLGILNSSVTNFLFRTLLPKLRGDFYEPSYVYFKEFPIRPINFSDPADKARYDQMVTLVEQMLELHKRKAETPDATGQERLQRMIDATDKQIDALVYALYGLSADEIAVVENAK